MSAVLNNPNATKSMPALAAELAQYRAGFQKKMLGVEEKVNAAINKEEIITDLSEVIRDLFNADRLTIYVLSEDKSFIISRVKTDLNAFRDLKLPLNENSIAGCSGVLRQTFNIRDVYDEAQLKTFNPNMRFLKEVDRRTGYRTKEMLVTPILDGPAKNADLMGVIQVINNRSGRPFGKIEEEGIVQLGRILAIAFAQRPEGLRPRGKYDYLVNDKSLSQDEFNLAMRSAKRKNIDLEKILLDEFQVPLANLGNSLSKFFSAPYEPFKADRIKPADLLKNIKREYAEASQWLPIDDTKYGLVVMCIDPEKIRASKIVSNIFPRTTRVHYSVTTQGEFQLTLDQMFGGTSDSGAANQDSGGSVDDLLSGMSGGDGDEEEVMAGEGAEVDGAADNELVQLVNRIVIDAYKMGASDIHIEPYPGKGKTEVRLRKDGSLMKYVEIPAVYRNAIVARLKIMCDLDISEKRRPQDGKIKFKKFGPLDIELRVATIPTAGGVEDIVMRILAAGEPIPVDKLGMTKSNLENLKKTVSKPYGLFFVCGPTGSGKTTTLHSVLGFLNTEDTKIWTAEDPVEITQKGLRQVQVNKKAGLDFPMVMKAFLRADPDIIMVGEMRDAETTSTGIEASLTGHLVFATLHTNSAPEAVIRLLDMGMDPFNFSDALLGILAQRLGKRLCGDCKEPYNPDATELKAFMTEYAEELIKTPQWREEPKKKFKEVYDRWLDEYGKEGKLVMYKAKGCSKCNNSGYRGRVGLHELMVASERVKRLIQERSRVSDLFTASVEEGMSTLKMDGMEKVLMGTTDLRQVRAVCIK